MPSNAAAKQASNVKPINPNTALVESAIAASNGNESVAVENLFRAVYNDPAFMKREAPALVRAWCQRQVGNYIGAQRVKAWTPPKPNYQATRLNAAVQASLLDFPLIGGMRLGDASVDDLRASSERYRGMSEDAAWKSRWLTRIEAEMGNAHRVEDVLSDTDLKKLQQETR